MIALLAAVALVAQEPPPRPDPPRAQMAGLGAWVIPGAVTADRQPDGNTVIFDVGTGYAVFDTGRHAWQAEAIIRFVDAAESHVEGIVNSHWHLDHVTGNLALAERWPEAPVYSSDAIDGAIDGFLRPSAARGEVFLATGEASPGVAEDVRRDIETIARIDELRPDHMVTGDGPLPIGNGRLQGRLARHAATAGDVWVFDPVSGVAAVGDLVTVPAPFLDTGCVDGWLEALEAIEAEDWSLLVPGHGPVMNRAMFATWRTAFAAFVDCARSDRNTDACAADWAGAVEALQPDAHSREQAAGFAAHYVGLLRSNGGHSPYCRS